MKKNILIKQDIIKYNKCKYILMNTKFEKIYVISVPSYKERYEFMKTQLTDLGIDFEFIWGTDFGNINHDALDYNIIYPQLFERNNKSTGKDFSCTVSHYNAIFQAYEFGYNNVLIIEDDVCFTKNKTLIHEMLNDIPDDADFVTYDPRFIYDEDLNKFYDSLNNCNELFMKDMGQYFFMFGGMLYGLMNRQTMKLYLDSQRNSFHMSDHVCGLFSNVSVNKYIAAKCICTDEYNIESNFNKCIMNEYKNNFTEKYYLTNNDFYNPDKYHVFARL